MTIQEMFLAFWVLFGGYDLIDAFVRFRRRSVRSSVFVEVAIVALVCVLVLPMPAWSPADTAGKAVAIVCAVAAMVVRLIGRRRMALQG